MNNIFLDKSYQNRFKKNLTKKSNYQDDIFTWDKQKEYNTFIIKKKNINCGIVIKIGINLFFFG